MISLSECSIYFQHEKTREILSAPLKEILAVVQRDNLQHKISRISPFPKTTFRAAGRKGPSAAKKKKKGIVLCKYFRISIDAISAEIQKEQWGKQKLDF